MSAEILVVDDESDIRNLVQEILEEEGYSVTAAASAKEARQKESMGSPDLVLLDIWMPEVDGITLLKEWSQTGKLKMPVVMMSGHGTVETAVEATRLGAFDFIEKPLSMAKLLSAVEKALKQTKKPAKKNIHSLIPPLIEPIGKSAVIKKAREDARKIAEQHASALILGESGTGREAFARYIHALSKEKTGAFVNLVPSTVSDDHAASVLFGEVVDSELRPGLLQQADDGVLFINELEDMSSSLQRLLYGVLEKEQFTPVNSRQPVHANFRLLSSSRPGFDQKTDALTFRTDLMQMISTLRLQIPPLREYLEDVPNLLRYYVDVMVEEHDLPFRRFSIAAQNRLRNYDWPGNMRQLKNVIHRLLVMADGSEIMPADVDAVLAIEPALHTGMMKEDWLSLPIREAREAFEKAYLEHQLKLCDGKVGKLATVVGMERTHLYRKLKTLGIEFGRSKES
ncbi:MAG: sigma-54-dependent Fis family transcriptional regulator [Gammaproteobacteria bacterium]|nr:sigma-54 dependent transcriptional regulator [Gammaproteobacteria bacterium]NNC96508.1 sigma-54-dependent Fis family transcriptional regulator [Gammaproteobacteria bacterium]NNM14708.1 sigma-54-dependent Fis family transcriptional regulator [Gammaproteobacteria bacterium]